jgi:hypothetical protein
LVGCTISGNTSQDIGGGSLDASLVNCLIYGNSAPVGGGAGIGTLQNCTVYSNYSIFACGGVYASSASNCIVYSNIGPTANYDETSSLNYCCTSPQPTNGFGNITNDPLFVDQTNGNFRLQSNSPCINSGKNAYAPAWPDLDGNPRIVGGTVDIGAYEFQFPQSSISYAWLQQYGFPTDGTADNADPDGDGMKNWQEWIAGTSPTNSLSALLMLAPSNSVSGISVPWQSVSGVTYFLQRSMDLSVQPTFTSIQSNLVGQAGVTMFTDTNGGGGPFFYRVGVQQ